MVPRDDHFPSGTSTGPGDGDQAARGAPAELTPPGSDAKLSELIEYLRKATSPDPARPRSYEALTAEINRVSGRGRISTTYTFHLAKGNRDNPTRDHLGAMAKAFGVDPAYLVERDMEEVRAAAKAVGVDGTSGMKSLLAFLVDYFRVDPDYFLDEEVRAKVHKELAFLDLVASGELGGVLARLEGLSDDGQSSIAPLILQIIEEARQREGLDESPLT